MFRDRDAASEGRVADLSRKLEVMWVAIQRSAKDGFSGRFMHLCDRKGFSGSAFIETDALRHPCGKPMV